ncbi:hypothetical protein AaE_014431 [Aphanomyces astaci]|uniref:Uncharacterized protein n=1 Tax=Aphanomyces astaci TaxID=112090 RepID=A0A6A4Z6Y2_APHAT|nr:hypothetical protein AaE_014431 [Aphanomyces astaci]
MDPVHRINDALRSMIMTQVQTVLFTTHLDADVKVCDATKSDWNWFVNTEYQELISRAIMWRDGAIYIVELPGGIHEDMRRILIFVIAAATGTFGMHLQPHGATFANSLEYQELISRAMMWRDGAIYIVELPGGIHEDMRRILIFVIAAATGTFGMHLQPHGATFANSLEHIEADECFGSAPSIGAVIPANLAWNEFHTLKIEVGISRNFSWRHLHLCIYISQHFEVYQYKRHSVEPPEGIMGMAPHDVAPIETYDAMRDGGDDGVSTSSRSSYDFSSPSWFRRSKCLVSAPAFGA